MGARHGKLLEQRVCQILKDQQTLVSKLKLLHLQNTTMKAELSNLKNEVKLLSDVLLKREERIVHLTNANRILKQKLKIASNESVNSDAHVD